MGKPWKTVWADVSWPYQFSGVEGDVIVSQRIIVAKRRWESAALEMNRVEHPKCYHVCRVPDTNLSIFVPSPYQPGVFTFDARYISEQAKYHRELNAILDGPLGEDIPSSRKGGRS